MAERISHSRVNLYDYQKEALKKLGSGSVLNGGVGSGKSIVAIAYYMWKECNCIFDSDGNIEKLGTPKNLYIITPAKKRDSHEWDSELLPFLLKADDRSFYGTNTTIDSWNNISKYVDVKDSFFIFDEQRVVGYGKWSKSFLKITSNNNWILLSATPGDVWMDYLPVFIANGFYKNKTDFIRKHVVYKRYAKFPQIDYYINEDRLQHLRDSILVQMDRPKNTQRHNHIVKVEHDKELYKFVNKELFNPYEDRPIKSSSEYCYILRRIVNSDKSRIDKLIELCRDKKVIVFYNFDYELDLIRSALEKNHITFSEWNGHKHQEIPNSESWVYLVQYSAGNDAWNCTDTDTMIFYSQTYSYKVLEQCMGRIDRVNNTYYDLHYYHLVSNSRIDYRMQQSVKLKKIFNYSAFAKVDAPALKTSAIIEEKIKILK